MSAIVIPIVVILLVLCAGMGVYFFIRKKPFKGSGLGSLASSQSVSFRQGTNVEFGGANSFDTNGAGTADHHDVAYSLDAVSNKNNRDFHNPMYDAVQNNPEAIANGSGALYEVTSDMGKTKGDTFLEPPSAVIAPSSIKHMSSPQVQVRHRELDPAAQDTGKDTQKLVEEDC